MTYDLIVRGGLVVRDDAVARADIGIADGQIAAIGTDLGDSTRQMIEADGQHIFPGVIDPHVHFNEPGRTEWEGFATGSRALAAGGGTLFFDMPLNSHPATIDGASFDAKRACAQEKSFLDFGLWGGLVPHNLDSLEELCDRGVVGFKAFMTASGVDDFPMIDHRGLRQGMKRLARLGTLLAVHAEWPALISQPPLTRYTIADYLETRPVEAEREAIRIAIELAGETGCRLHIVHLSAGSSVELILEARAKGVDVSCETCPHYLLLTARDMEQLGAVAKCAPPLRDKREQEQLWDHLAAGAIDFLASDHSPAPLALKQNADFFRVWGGISSCQHAWPLLLAHLDPLRLAKLTATNVAKRFGIALRKGRVAVGADADLVIVDRDASQTVRRDDLLYRHPHSPYVGQTIRGRVRRTILRGQTVVNDGKIVSAPRGRLVKPVRTAS